MSKTRWPDAAVNMTAWIAIALIVYSAASCFSKSIDSKYKAEPVRDTISEKEVDSLVKEFEKKPAAKEDPNHGVHFKLVDP